MLRRTAALSAALLLSGCAALPAAKTPAPTFPLLAPATLGTSRSVQQILHVAYGDQEATLNAVLTATPGHLQVIALNAMGLRLFTVDYDAAGLKAERMPGLPEQIDPARVLADLQLAFWPLAALQTAAQGTDWQISEPYFGTRRLKRAGRLIAEVHYADNHPWRGRLWLANYEFGYSLAVESAALGAP